MITLEQMRCFCAVYEHGSYSNAAKKLKKDRSTVREHVTSLEDSLGVELFHIKGRKSVATEFAKSMHYRSKLIVKHAQNLEQDALSFFNQKMTQVNIYHDALIPTSMILQINKNFHASYPSVQLNWLQKNREETREDLISGQCHLAIMPINSRDFLEKQVWYRNIGQIKLAPYAKPDSPLAQSDSIGLRDLQVEKQFISENHLRAGLDTFKVSPNHHIISSNDMMAELIKHDGWAILSQPFAQSYIERGELVRLYLQEFIHDYRLSIALYFTGSTMQHSILKNVSDWITDYSKVHLA